MNEKEANAIVANGEKLLRAEAPARLKELNAKKFLTNDEVNEILMLQDFI